MKKVFWITVLCIVFVDVLTKQLARIGVIASSGNLLDFTYVQNTGSLFSLFNTASSVNTVFIIISILALIIIGYYFKHTRDIQLHIPFMFITAGIIGNLLDRIFFGGVIDWINFHFWPIFNIADSVIIVGVIYAFWTMRKASVDRESTAL